MSPSSEKPTFDSQSLANLPWKDERRSQILDASTMSLNKLLSNNLQHSKRNDKQLPSSSNNSKSSGNLLCTDGFTDQEIHSGFFTLHSKRFDHANKPTKQNCTLKSSKIPLFYDRAHSCHNLLVYKNASILNENHRLLNEINQRTNLHRKINNYPISLQKVEPAPNLPIRYQSSTTLRGIKSIYNNNKVTNSEKDENNFKTDYDKLSSTKLLSNYPSDISDYSEFSNKISEPKFQNLLKNCKLNEKIDSTLTNIKLNERQQLKQINDLFVKEKDEINETNEENKKYNEIYDDLNDSLKLKPIVAPKPLISPKPTAKTINNVTQRMHQFCNLLLTTNLQEIAFWITEEDCNIFCINNEVSFFILI